MHMLHQICTVSGAEAMYNGEIFEVYGLGHEAWGGVTVILEMNAIHVSVF